jgi:hypothetical protein
MFFFHSVAFGSGVFNGSKIQSLDLRYLSSYSGGEARLLGTLATGDRGL